MTARRSLGSGGDTTDAAIRHAIAERRLIAFDYRGAARVCEPHDYGVRNGKAQLLTYQVSGVSRSGRVPDWRSFAVSEISGARVLSATFPGSRPAGAHVQWDELWASVSHR